MLNWRHSFVFLFCLLPFLALSQETFPTAAPSDDRPEWIAFVNAHIVVSPTQTIPQGTMVVKKGIIQSVGVGVAVPPQAQVIDLEGQYLYPALIDLWTDLGIDSKVVAKNTGSPQYETNQSGAFAWNDALQTSFDAVSALNLQDDQKKEWLSLGFGAVMGHRMDGISRGTGVLYALSNDRAHTAIILPKAAHVLSMSKGSSNLQFPSSKMGVIALLRQTYYDANWYVNFGQKKEFNQDLTAWNAVASLPQIWETRGWQDIMRAGDVSKEFNKTYIFTSLGDDYQRIEAVKKTAAGLIVPLNFPVAYDVENPYDALEVDFDDLKHWEWAPSNPAQVAAAKIPMAITTAGLEKKNSFWPHLRKAIQYGLSEEDALAALTLQPAKMLGADKQLGTLEKDKIANFIITDGPLFLEKTKISATYVQGKPVYLAKAKAAIEEGQYQLQLGDRVYILQLAEKEKEFQLSQVIDDSVQQKIKMQLQGQRVQFAFAPKGSSKLYRLTGTVNGNIWQGNGQDENGLWESWSAKRIGAAIVALDTSAIVEKTAKTVAASLTYPFQAFGRTSLPQEGKYLIKNATIWTCEKEGVLKEANILINKGKVEKIGKSISSDDAIVIDGTGKHITPGIVDEHSHIALVSVNEGSQESSAEVRMRDVIDPEDVNIYRQLSGGVTTSQLLHGSANPIGGQSALIKLRWGQMAEGLLFEGADGFIKFALGENVKQSNWGDRYRTRYPQTRMGVEQVFLDYFQRAKAYGELKKSGKAFRTDIELETILEIIERKRFITCHSYVQSEINMLMKVAEQFGFRVNTFTHILEGYKVADKMQKHGVAASTFSDWWAYKMEVRDAIPYNAAIMHAQGVLVGINSDDAEMARRLNQEAGKTVKYGGVSEEDALKMVTLNPAKMLHIDHRTGSLKEGKDADVVLWSDHPLSIRAVAEKTFVDGRLYFDRVEDAQLQVQVQQERNRLIQAMLEEKKEGKPTKKVSGSTEKHFHCDTIDGEESEGYEH